PYLTLLLLPPSPPPLLSLSLLFFLLLPPPPKSPLFPYTTLFRSATISASSLICFAAAITSKLTLRSSPSFASPITKILSLICIFLSHYLNLQYVWFVLQN